MSDVPSILAKVKQAGLRLEVAGENLRLLGRKDVSDEIVALIRDNKPEILSALLHAPRRCPRHASLRSCIAPPVEKLEAGICVCCGAALAPDAFGQCNACHGDIRRVLTRLTPAPDGDSPG